MVRKGFRWILAAGFLVLALGGRIRDSIEPHTEFSYPVTRDPSESLEPKAEALGLAWPPQRLRLVALKEEKVLEVWIADASGPYRRLTTYAITAASWIAGPKRKEGDFQVPEGIYRLTTLNPQSRYHLSVRIDYPNAADLANAEIPRNEMGGDIYLHGKDVSIGCIAIGDEAIERLYDLIGRVPLGKRDIVIAPVDFRRQPGYRIQGEEPWVDVLYERLERELLQTPLSGGPKEAGL